MSQKIFRRRSSLFRLCFLILLIALFSFNAPAQGEEKQNQPKETEKCKGDAILCERIESATRQISAEKKRGSEFYYFWYYRRAELYLKKGDIASALSDVNIFLKEAVVSASGLTLRGEIYLKQAKYDEALKDFEAAVKISPNSSDALLGRGVAYYYKREYDSAFDDLNRAIELHSRSSTAYYYRALILTFQAKNLIDNENYAQATENYKKAVEDFTSVIDIDLRKVNPKVYFLRARLYEALDEKEKAEADRKMYEELSEKP